MKNQDESDRIKTLFINSGKLLNNGMRYLISIYGDEIMIKIKLCELMGREKMTRKKLSELTGIRPNTIGDLYREDIKKIDLHILDKICEVFECEIADLLEYVPNTTKENEEDVL